MRPTRASARKSSSSDVGPYFDGSAVLARFRSLAGVAVVLAGLATAVPVGVAGAQTDGTSGVESEPDFAATDTDLLDALAGVGLVDEWLAVGTIDPRSKLVEVSGGIIDEVRQSLIDDAIELAQARTDGARLAELLAQLDEIDSQLLAERNHFEGRVVVSSVSLAVVDTALASAAVTRYVLGTNLAPSGDDIEAIYTDATRSTLVDVTLEDLLMRREVLIDRIAGFEKAAAELADAMTENDATRGTASSEAESLQPRWDELEEAVRSQFISLGDLRVGGIVDGLGITLVTLDAYLTGEAVLAESRPECGIRWQAIAAISRVESNHGRDHGGRVLPDGRLSSPFLGVVLDGRIEGTEVITDTDGGAIDGDAEFDRAVGPFQFLPRSWRVGAIDGNNDDLIDVNNLYDGAASAAEYLCSRVSGLSDNAALRNSFLRYNASGRYADEVFGWVQIYDRYQIDTSPFDESDAGLVSGN